MSSAAAKKRLTAREYLEIERAAATKSEFLDGEMYAMAGGTEGHSLVATNLARRLGNALEGRPCRIYNSDMRVYYPSGWSIHRGDDVPTPPVRDRRTPLAAGMYSYPDLSVVCGPPEFLDDHRDTLTNPGILIEVLSPSTEREDRGRKFRMAREIPSLQNYVLVAQDRMLVEQYVRQADGNWLLQATNSGTLTLHKLDVSLALAEIYANVEFPPDDLEPVVLGKP